MHFLDLAQLFQKIEHTDSSNEIQKILAEFFRKADDTEISKIAYLTLGTIASSYDDINLGMADKMVIKSIAHASKKSEQEIKNDYNRKYNKIWAKKNADKISRQKHVYYVKHIELFISNKNFNNSSN